jgi:hypothetical protein
VSVTFYLQADTFLPPWRMRLELTRPNQVGTMNLFVAFKQPDGTVELVTPPLDDVVLPGVTRDRCVFSISWLCADAAAHGSACNTISHKHLSRH